LCTCQEFSPTPVCISLQSLTGNFAAFPIYLISCRFFAELHSLLGFDSSECFYISKFFHLLIHLRSFNYIEQYKFPFVLNSFYRESLPFTPCFCFLSLNCNLKECDHNAGSQCACVRWHTWFCIRLAINIF